MPKLSDLGSKKIKIVQPTGRSHGPKKRSGKLRDIDRSKVKVIRKPKEPGMVDSFSSGLEDAITFGYRDEADALIGAGVDKLFGAEEPYWDAYEKNLERSRYEAERAQEKNPWSYAAGQFVPAAMGGASTAGKAAAGWVGKSVPRAAALAGAEGALYGSGASEADSLSGRAKDALMMGAGAAATGGALQGGLNALASKGGQKYSRAIYDYLVDRFDDTGRWLGTGARKMGGILSKVDDEHAKRYLKRRDAIRDVDESALSEEVYDQVNELKNTKREADAAKSVAAAEKRAADRALKEDLKRQGVPEAVIDDVRDGLDELRSSTSAKSTQAYDVLDNVDFKVKLSPLKSALTKAMKKFHIAGQEPPKGTPGYERLKYYREYLDDLSENTSELDAKDVKTFIRALQDDLSSAFESQRLPGQKPTQGERALMNFQQNLNERLKEIPDYRDIMQELAEETNVSVEAGKTFGANRTRPQLEKLYDPRNVKQRKLMGKVDEYTGKNILGQIEEYERAKKTLKDPALLRAEQDRLPETDILRQAESQAAEASEKAKPVMGVNSPKTFLQRAADPSNIKEREIVEHLEKTYGSELGESLLDLRAQKAFNADQSGGRGHRYALLGGGLGAATAGPWGATTGAMAGAALDRNAGKIFRSTLDVGQDYLMPAADKLMTTLRAQPERLGRYARPLMEASQRGSTATGAAHYILWQRDPEYRAIFQGGQDDDDMEATGTDN